MNRLDGFFVSSNEDVKEIILEMVLANIEVANFFRLRRSIETINFSSSESFRSAMRRMPYVVEHGWVLNREYSPLWSRVKNSLPRDNYPKLETEGVKAVYFYNDSCVPWGSKKELNQYCKILDKFTSYLKPEHKSSFKSFADEVSIIRGLSK